MALTVPCPACGTKLLAPDSAVGQRLRCPKCGTLATVPNLLPAEEVQVVEAKVVPPTAPPAPAPPPAPVPKPVLAEAVEERRRKASRFHDDYEDEDRPRKKKRPRYADDDDEYDHDKPRIRSRRKSGSGGAIVGAFIFAGVLLLVGVGVAVYLIAANKGSSSSAKKTSVPPGWTQYSYPNDGFKVYLPKPPDYQSLPIDGFGREFGRGRAGRGPFGWDFGNDALEPDRATMLSTHAQQGELRIELIVIRFRDRVPASVRDRVRQITTDGQINGHEVRTVRWLGYDALEQSQPGGVVRLMIADRHLVAAVVHGPNGGRARPEDEAGFFDNFELTN